MSIFYLDVLEKIEAIETSVTRRIIIVVFSFLGLNRFVILFSANNALHSFQNLSNLQDVFRNSHLLHILQLLYPVQIHEFTVNRLLSRIVAHAWIAVKTPFRVISWFQYAPSPRIDALSTQDIFWGNI